MASSGVDKHLKLPERIAIVNVNEDGYKVGFGEEHVQFEGQTEEGFCPI